MYIGQGAIATENRKVTDVLTPAVCRIYMYFQDSSASLVQKTSLGAVSMLRMSQ